MTLPSTNLPIDPQCLPGVPGMPAVNSEINTAAAASNNSVPFASLLGDASPGNGATSPAAMNDSPALPNPVVVDAVLASPACCLMMNAKGVLTPATLAGDNASENADEDSADLATTPPEDAETDISKGSEWVAYQLVAGQWIQQPTVYTMPPTSTQSLDGELSADETKGTARSAADMSIDAATGGKIAPRSAFAASTGAEQAYIGQNATRDFSPSPDTNAKAPVTAPQKVPDATKAAVIPDQSAATKVAQDNLAPETQPAASADPAMVSSETPLTRNVRNLVQQGRENFAAPGLQERTNPSSGGITPVSSQEKKTLIADRKKVATVFSEVGTPGANRENSMLSSAPEKPVFNDASLERAVVAPAKVAVGAAQPVTEAAASAATQAPRLVKEIHAIADRISSIERNTVEVRFDFSDSDRLSVRVAYHDGSVHTTFRTDSNLLRDAISHQWQIQANDNSEQRNYRLADPVFTSASGSSQEFSTSGGGSDQSQRFEESVRQNLQGFSQNGRSGRGGSQPTTAATPAGQRIDSTRLFHHFA
ncbi:MAG: hypothetical protein QM790_14830 [Nibricoccus sp.]